MSAMAWQVGTWINADTALLTELKPGRPSAQPGQLFVAEAIDNYIIWSLLPLLLYTSLALNFCASSYHQTPSGQGEPSNSGHRSKDVTLARSNTSKKRSNKKAIGQQGDDENDDQLTSQPSGSSLIEARSSAQKRLACPFHKFDSYLFGPDSPEPDYRNCGSCNFKHAAHLKQHLQRVHTIPRLECDICHRHNFQSDADLAKHRRGRCTPITPRPYSERIDTDSDLAKLLTLHQENPPKFDRVVYWRDVFVKLFPDFCEDVEFIDPYFRGTYQTHLENYISFAGGYVNRVGPTQIATFNQDSDPCLDITNTLQTAFQAFNISLKGRQWPRLGVPRQQGHAQQVLPQTNATTEAITSQPIPTTSTSGTRADPSPTSPSQAEIVGSPYLDDQSAGEESSTSGIEQAPSPESDAVVEPEPESEPDALVTGVSDNDIQGHIKGCYTDYAESYGGGSQWMQTLEMEHKKAYRYMGGGGGGGGGGYRHGFMHKEGGRDSEGI